MRKIIRDLFILVVSVGVAALIARSGALDQVFSTSPVMLYLFSFVVGIFFTSIVSVGPATVMLLKLTELGNPLGVASLAAAGAVIGDLAIYFFVKNNLSRDARVLAKPLHFKKVFQFHFLRWLGPLVGGVIIILPLLPDELGLALMGFRSMSLPVLAPLLFGLNFLGVLAINGFVKLFT